MAILDDVKAYLATVGVPTTKYTDQQLSQVISTESAAQTRKTGGNGSGTYELNEALCRRVYVNLSKRPFPLGVADASGDSDGRVFVPAIDREIRRLEAPFRRIDVR